MISYFKIRPVLFCKPPFYSSLVPVLALIITLLSLQSLFGQTKGLIHKPAASTLGRDVLDPNRDSYVSASSTGFATAIYEGTESDLQMLVLPVMIAEPPADLTNGAFGGHTDFVSNSINHSCYILYKTVNGTPYFIVRFRIV